MNNTRENTFTEALVTDDVTISGIRRVSMGSIALLQMIDNPLLDVVLNGGTIPYNQTLQVLQFIWLHTVDSNLAARAALRYSSNPDYMNEQVLAWAVSISPDKMLEYIQDIIRDQDNINNSKSKVIPDKGSKTRKNQHSQVC